MKLKLTDQERAAIKNEFDRITAGHPAVPFDARLRQSFSVLQPDRRPQRAKFYPTSFPWLGAPKAYTHGTTNPGAGRPTTKPGQPSTGAPTRASARGTGRPKVGGRRKTPLNSSERPAPESVGLILAASIEAFVEQIAGLITLRISASLDASAVEMKQRTESGIKKLADLRQELIAARARRDDDRATEIIEQMKRLEAWKATGPRAAAEVGE
jgi:hypothetical protein